MAKACKLIALLAVLISTVILSNRQTAGARPLTTTPIVHEETRSGGSAGATTVTTIGSLAGVNGHLYLAAISTRPRVSVLSVAGLGLNWTLVRSKCAGKNTTGIEVWMAQGTPSSSGTVTATFGSAPGTAVIAVSRYSGVVPPGDGMNPIGNVIAGNTNGMNTNGVCSGGVDNSAYSFDLSTNINNVVVYVAAAMKARTHTPGPGFTERREMVQPGGANTSSVAVEDTTIASPSTVTVNGSFNGPVDWAVVALVIKPKPPQYTVAVNTRGSGSVTLNPPGGIYEAGTVVTLTAAPDAEFNFSNWSDALSGSTNPATLTMNTDRKVTANFKANTSPSGPIIYEGTRLGTSSNSTTVATSESMVGANGNLYLATISTQPRKSVLSVTGFGLSWSLVRAKCAGRNTTGIEVWMAQGTPSSDDIVTAILGSAPNTAVIAVSRYSGVAPPGGGMNPIGNVIAGNTNGMNTNGVCTGGVDNSAYAFNLNTTANNAVVYVAAAMNSRTHTPGPGYAERGEVHHLNGAKASSVAVEDKTVASAGNVAVNGSFNDDVDWVMVALEIKPLIPKYTLAVNKLGSGDVTLNPPGGVYDAGTVVSLTATPAAGFQFSGWSGNLSGSANPVNITMDGNKNVTATFTPQYTLTVNKLGSGDVTLDPPGGLYNAGTVVTLTATPNSGFQFDSWSGALSGSANPTSITMNANKNVTAIFSSDAPIDQILHQETQTGGSSGATSVATSANLIGVKKHLYLAAISTRPRVQATSVSGLGLSWKLVRAQCSGRDNTGVEVWMAQGTPNSNGVVTAAFPSAVINAVIAVSRYSGVNSVNPTGNVISGNTNGLNGLCSTGVDTNLYSFNLTATNGAVVYGAVALRSRTHTPGANYTERTEIMQGTTDSNTAGIATEDQTVALASTVKINGSLSGDTDWAVVAVELKPLPKLTVNILGSGNVTLNPPGGTYEAGTVVTLTATPTAGFQFSGWSGDLSGSANPANILMNGNKNVMATFAPSSSGNYVVLEEIQTGASTESETVTTSGNLTGVSGHLYLAAISTKARVHLDSLSGLGLTWTLVQYQCSGRGSTMVEMWMAMGTPSSNGPVTAFCTGAPTSSVITVMRYSGINSGDPIGNVISGSTNGEDGGGSCVLGTDSDHYSFSLTTTTNNAVVCAAVALRSRTHTPGAGYTERAEVTQGTANTAAGIAVADKNVELVSTVSVDGSLSGDTDWSVVAVEIKPQASAGKSGTITADGTALPSNFALEPNYPNPFNPSTVINFSLPAASKVMLNVYDITGQLVRTLASGEMAAGRHSVRWHGSDKFNRIVAAGIYLYKISAEDQNGNPVFTQTRRMIFLK